MITVDNNVNNGKPSIKCQTKGYVTVKGIISLVHAGLGYTEIVAELDIIEQDINDALDYNRSNP